MDTIQMIPWRYYVKYVVRGYETRNRPLFTLQQKSESFDSIEMRDAFIEDMQAKHGSYFSVVELSDNELERALTYMRDREQARAEEFRLTHSCCPLNPGRAQNTDEVLMGRSRW